MRTNRHDGGPVSVVDRISILLNTFTGAGPLTLSQITQRTGLPRSSVHRLLEQLAGAGWLAREDHTYELGIRAYETGQSALTQNRLRLGATQTVRRLAQTTGMTVHLAAYDRGDVIYLDKLSGINAPTLPTRIGARVPAHLTAVGKVVMANFDADRRSKVLGRPLQRRTVHSITSPAQLDEEFERIRDHGVAYDRGELLVGIGCVAATIGSASDQYGNRAAISVCGPVRDVKFNRLAGAVRMAARDIWNTCVSAHLAAEQEADFHRMESKIRSA